MLARQVEDPPYPLSHSGRDADRLLLVSVTGALGRCERRVRPQQEKLLRVAGVGEDRGSVGEGHARLESGHLGADALGRSLGALSCGLRKEERELVVTEARGHVGAAGDRGQGGAEPAQYPVALHPSATLVETAESIDVQYDDAELAAVPPHPLDLAVDGGVEVALVGQPGQRIPEGELVEVHEVLPELLFGLLALGDVLHLADEVDRLAGGPPHERYTQEAPRDRAVRAYVALLELEAVDLSVEHAQDLLDVEVDVVLMGHRPNVEPGQLLLRPSDQVAQGRIGGEEPPVEVHEGHPDGSRLEGALKARVSLLKGPLGLGRAALADVVEERVEDRGPAYARRRDAQLDRNLAAVTVKGGELEAASGEADLPALEKPLHSPVVGFAVALGDDQLRHRTSACLLAGPAEGLLGGLVPGDDGARRVDRHERLVGGLEDRPCELDLAPVGTRRR